MEPRIHDGDLVAIRKQPEVENGEIAAVRINGEATLKHVYLHDSFIELRPENPAFNSIILSREDMNTVVIEGKAVGTYKAERNLERWQNVPGAGKRVFSLN